MSFSKPPRRVAPRESWSHLAVSEAADAATIGAAKQALWTALAGTTYRDPPGSPGLPVVVLDASAETLGVLAGSPSVVHVSEDEIRRPQQ